MARLRPSMSARYKCPSWNRRSSLCSRPSEAPCGCTSRSAISASIGIRNELHDEDLVEGSQYAIGMRALRVIGKKIYDSQRRPGRQHQETSVLLGRLQQELFGLALGFCIQGTRKWNHRRAHVVVAQRGVQHALAGDRWHGLKIGFHQGTAHQIGRDTSEL